MTMSSNDNPSDHTEATRRRMVGELNQQPRTRADLETVYGQVWDTTELGQDFEPLGFLAPFIIVKRKSDGLKGTLMFQHDPRFYFDFTGDPQ